MTEIGKAQFAYCCIDTKSESTPENFRMFAEVVSHIKAETERLCGEECREIIKKYADIQAEQMIEAYKKYINTEEFQ